MRRLMERENKKIRDDYKRDYNEAVRVSNSCTPLQFGADMAAIGLVPSASRP